MATKPDDAIRALDIIKKHSVSPIEVSPGLWGIANSKGHLLKGDTYSEPHLALFAYDTKLSEGVSRSRRIRTADAITAAEGGFYYAVYRLVPANPPESGSVRVWDVLHGPGSTIGAEGEPTSVQGRSSFLGALEDAAGAERAGTL